MPERLGCCHGPAQAQGQYAQWARKHLHRESLREVSRCRHAALDRLLLRPTETFAGDPDHCRMMDDSPNDPGVANAWDSFDARGAHEDRPHRGASPPPEQALGHCGTGCGVARVCPSYGQIHPCLLYTSPSPRDIS